MPRSSRFRTATSSTTDTVSSKPRTPSPESGGAGASAFSEQGAQDRGDEATGGGSHAERGERLLPGEEIERGQHQAEFQEPFTQVEAQGALLGAQGLGLPGLGLLPDVIRFLGLV